MLVAVLIMMCFMSPVTGPVLSPYAPVGQYAGHWGIDIAAPVGSDVRSPVEGVVSFAGTVAGMRTVTVRTSDSTRVSLSYLDSIEVSTSDEVNAGDIVGTSGRAHGINALHVSVRIAGEYVDPERFFSCAEGVIRLLPDPPD